MSNNYNVNDKVVIIKGEQIHGFKVGSTQIITSIGMGGTLFIRNERGFAKMVNPDEIKPVDPNYSDDVPEGEFVPRFFKRTAICETNEERYYFREGNIYIEIDPKRWDELGIDREAIENLDLFEEEKPVLITDEDGYTLMGSFDLEDDFEEILTVV